MTEPRKAVRSRLVFMIVSVVTVAPFAMGALIEADQKSEDSLYKQLSVLSEVLSLIQRTYVDETSIRGLLDGALEGATDALDPMSTFVPADASRSYAAARAIGSGHSGLTVARDRGVAYVVAVTEGSPGEAAGLRSGDVISALGGVSTRNMPLWRLEAALAGEPGTELELEVLRNGQNETLTLRLDAYAAPPPELDRHHDVAVLRIPSIAAGAVGPARDILASIGGEDRLIVDLRGVAGGDAEAAYSLAGLFATGRLGVLKARDSEIQAFDNDFPALWQGRAVVVVDSGTQGPAEILASVLKQSLPATLVGQPTFGLAGRRGVIELPSGSQVVMTDALFSGPDGDPIDERLKPDEVVRESLRSLGSESVSLEDLMLDRAVEVLERSEQKVA